MTRRTLRLCLPFLILLFGFARAGSALPGPQEEATESEASEATGPGTPRNHLAATVGEWDLTIHMWTNPNSDPQESRGFANARWILGENFVETRLEGEVLGTDFEGLRIEGYDVAAEKFVSTWRDSRGTYTLIFQGKCDADCGIRTMTAPFIDPISKTELTIKSVTTILGTDSYRYETYIVTPSGTEIKNMELDAVRKP